MLKALDLFCGAGGASMGLHRAGFDVTGVDLAPQPCYPFKFVQGDALTFPLKGYDLVWASPPCQAHTSMRAMWNANEYPDLIPATRSRLMAWGGLYIIENVVGAPLINPILLCGSMFGLGATINGERWQLRRHRLFESNFGLVAPSCSHRSPTIGVYGDHARDRRRRPGAKDRGIDFPDRDGFRFSCEALGIDWMRWKGLAQSIPPAYSEYLAKQAVAKLASLSSSDYGAPNEFAAYAACD